MVELGDLRSEVTRRTLWVRDLGCLARPTDVDHLVGGQHERRRHGSHNIAVSAVSVSDCRRESNLDTYSCGRVTVIDMIAARRGVLRKLVGTTSGPFVPL